MSYNIHWSQNTYHPLQSSAMTGVGGGDAIQMNSMNKLG